jgi:hypothetical protein
LFPAVVKVVPSTLVSTLIHVTYEFTLAPCVTTALSETTASRSNFIHEVCVIDSATDAVQLPAEFRENRLYAVFARICPSANEDAVNWAKGGE